MEVIIGATVGAVLLAALIVYGIFTLYNRGNRGNRGATLIVLPPRSPTQIMGNLAAAFPAEIPQSRMNTLAEEVARLRARPNVVTKNGKPYLVVTQSRKRRNQK